MNKTQKIKLLILTPTLECGGSEKFVSLVCNHINTQMFSVCLVIVNNSMPFFTITNPAIKTVDLKKSRVLFSLFAITAAVKSFDPDIVFSTANHLNIYLAIFRNRFKKSIQMIAREASIVSVNSQQAPMPALYNWLIKKYYKRFDHIICQSGYMQQDLIVNYKIPLSHTTVIHNATPEVLNRPHKKENQASERIYKFITIARLTGEKGVNRLIQAVALLSEPFIFYIIGDGKDRIMLQKMVNEQHLQDKVFLLGEQKDPFHGMEEVDLFLFGSYYEGFPNVLLEAGAQGIPVVAFNAPGGIAEIITENENGLLVKNNDIIGFAAAIKNALAEDFDREQIIATTKKRFSVSTMMTAMENIFLKFAPNK